jgi:hypothetical protein
MKFQCPGCKSSFTRKRNLEKHYFSKHLSTLPSYETCFLCGLIFSNCDELDNHYKSYHKPSKYFEVKESAFKRSVLVYRLIYDQDKVTSVDEALNYFIQNEIEKVIHNEVCIKNVIKITTIFVAQFTMLGASTEAVVAATIPFRATAFNASAADRHAIKKNIIKSLVEQENKVDTFINNGSNWVFEKPVAMDLEIGTVQAMLVGGESELSTANIDKIVNKKHLISVPSRENKCFLYCIAESLFGSKIIKRKSAYEYENIFKKFHLKNLEFPISIKHIKKFVTINPHLSLKINIFYLAGKDVYPLECGIGSGKNVVNLLKVCLEKNKKDISHFILIKNLDKFLSKTYQPEGKKKTYEAAFYCPNCINKFSKKKNRDEHFIYCSSNKPRMENVPDHTNNKIQFLRYENQYMKELCAYLDFESELPKTGLVCKICETLRCKCDMSYTLFESEHKPICFSFVIVNSENDILYQKTYSGKNAGDVFVDDLLNQEKMWLYKYLNDSKIMNSLTEKEEIDYHFAKDCYICEKKFSPSETKVRDHNHRNGQYIGPAHQSCNLRRTRQKNMNVYMHNGSKYDFHFIVKALAKRNLKKLYVLPFNMENFRMIRFNSFTLLDSLAFLQSPLAQLSDELYQSNHNYPIIRKSKIVTTDGKFDEEKFQMILKKGHFPYEYW